MQLSVLLVGLSLVVMVTSEPCQTNRDCDQHGTTHCEHNTHVVCLPSVGQCVCTDAPVNSGSSCRLVSDCPSCTGNSNPHCIDGRCVCTRN